MFFFGRLQASLWQSCAEKIDSSTFHMLWDYSMALLMWKRQRRVKRATVLESYFLGFWLVLMIFFFLILKAWYTLLNFCLLSFCWSEPLLKCMTLSWRDQWLYCLNVPCEVKWASSSEDNCRLISCSRKYRRYRRLTSSYHSPKWAAITGKEQMAC